MADTQTLNQEQTLALRLAPQQLRYVRLLEMNASELDEAVVRELEANPALGEADAPVSPSADSSARRDDREYGDMPAYRPGHLATSEDVPTFVIPSEGASMYDILDEQLGSLVLRPEVLRGARYIVASLDSNGYLRRDLNSLADDMFLNHGISISPDDLREALRVVQSLDPAGVGGTSLQETLLLQLRRMPQSLTRDDAIRILTDEFDAFSKKHIHRLGSAAGMGRDRVTEAVELIRGLNPKPGASLGTEGLEESLVIVPDVVLERDENGDLSVNLNNRFPELTIQKSFAQAVAEMEAGAQKRSDSKGDREYILSNYNDARDFMRILNRRQQTLVDVVTAIIKIQKEYFDTEDVYALRPMMLKDIASLTGLDLSVISRATSGKYLETPWGIFPLRFFFSDSKGEEHGGRRSGSDGNGGSSGRSGNSGSSGSDGNYGSDGSSGNYGSSGSAGDNTLTNRMIEAIIRRLVQGEDKHHPLSDEKLRRAMLAEGYDLSRRAITKYRDRIGIPVARLRKEY